MFDEEYAEHAGTIWHNSDGPAGGGWASGTAPDGVPEFNYVMKPEPLGDKASAPKPDPLLYATSPVPAQVRSAAVVMGPVVVVAVAHVDPGNFATNMAGGATHGFLLLWVIVSASLLAMYIQYQSAKLGIVTGRNLPKLCREHYPRPVTGMLWVQAELVAMATDLAEFVGAAVCCSQLGWSSANSPVCGNHLRVARRRGLRR